MRICFIADGRSPITHQWVNYFPGAGHEVHLISTFPCDARPMPGVRVVQFALAFTQAMGANVVSGPDGSERDKQSDGLRPFRWRTVSQVLRRLDLGSLWLKWVAPFSAIRLSGGVLRYVKSVQPDLVHALRIPCEAELAALAHCSPLIVSVWGNDFTFVAGHSVVHGILTRHTLRRTDALTCDCQRDMHLARRWGLPADRFIGEFLTSGGVRLDIFNRDGTGDRLRKQLGIPAKAPVVLNPRGSRGYVRTDTFFRAIPAILRSYPDAIFVCVAMRQQTAAQAWVDQYGIEDSVRLMDPVPHHQMAQYYKLADIMISPTVHDGTPNTLVEGMACGCFPVYSDLPPTREWIEDGKNGKLFDPNRAASLADATVVALADPGLRQRAAEINWQLVNQRVDYARVMPRVEGFYKRVLQVDKPRGAQPLMQDWTGEPI